MLVSLWNNFFWCSKGIVLMFYILVILYLFKAITEIWVWNSFSICDRPWMRTVQRRDFKETQLQYFHVWQVFLWWSLEKVVTNQKEKGRATKKKYFTRKYQVQVERCCPDIYKHYLHATNWQKNSSAVLVPPVPESLICHWLI